MKLFDTFMVTQIKPWKVTYYFRVHIRIPEWLWKKIK